MNLLFPGRAEPLDAWERRPCSSGSERGPSASDLRLVCERVIASEPPGPPLADGPHRRAAAAVLRYQIFPPALIRAVLRRSPVEVGDTVGASYAVAAGFRLFFASRVVARFDGADAEWWRTGFTYRTLDGHPELGEETFAIEKRLDTGEVRAALRSWSRPGLWYTRAGGPLLRLVQRRANAAALDQLQATSALAGGS